MTAHRDRFLFHRHEVDERLGRFVRSVWYAKGTIAYRRERIAPTGSTVVVVILGDPIRQIPDNGKGQTVFATAGFVVGPHNGPVINEPTGETHAVGIVTTSIGCEALFNRRPSGIQGNVVKLEDFWPAGLELRQRLLGVEDPATATQMVEALLRSTVDDQPNLPAGIDYCERAVAALESDPTRPIADIAAEVGVSHNTLNRGFRRVVGLSPRSLASILRVRRLLTDLDVYADHNWIDVADRHGWYDQAHLIRDFRRYTGASPTEYVAAQRHFLGEVSGPDGAGFVPLR